MPVKQIIAELDEPEMAPRSRGLAALEVLGHDHLRCVQGDDRDAAPAQRGNGVFGISNRHVRPELLEQTHRLLRAMQFTGIAEVEYKWDAAARTCKLIEINPRPWDQHMLGRTCGVDLIHLAYCDHAGLPRPVVRARASAAKWISDDVFAMAALRSLRRRDGRLRTLFRLARGNRIYGIWSARDPIPFLAYFTLRLIPQLAWNTVRQVWMRFSSRMSRVTLTAKGGSAA